EAKREILRQARWGFNLYLVSVAAFVVIAVVGATLLLRGKTTEGSVTTAAGLLSGAYCSQLAKESQDKLEHLLQGLNGLDKK
ncbi:MAG: hypothetical protein VKJ46_09885, partial [Leptolyngbyaceae bacterium]|nr:hypothetical protein [Leptolyngbyaceae bacterium]